MGACVKVCVSEWVHFEGHKVLTSLIIFQTVYLCVSVDTRYGYSLTRMVFISRLIMCGQVRPCLYILCT